jgi:hypothetical protein
MAEGQMTGDATGCAPHGVTLRTVAATVLDRSVVAGQEGVTGQEGVMGQERVQENEQVLLPFAEHNAVAVVPSAQARGVISALERAGVDGDRISFLRLDAPSRSPALDATPSPGLDVGPIGQRDEMSVVARALLAAVAGAVVIGSMVLVVADAESALWAALGGVALGGALGALWGIFRRLGASDAWERSLHTDAGARAMIGVHLDAADGDPRVTQILEPYGVWVFARDGSINRPSSQSV